MESEKQSIVVKVSPKITIPFWTAGFLYVAGALLSQGPNEAFFNSPWYAQLLAGIAVYFFWPAVLGGLHYAP